MKTLTAKSSLKKLTDKQIIRMAEKFDRQARRITRKAHALRVFIVDRANSIQACRVAGLN